MIRATIGNSVGGCPRAGWDRVTLNLDVTKYGKPWHNRASAATKIEDIAKWMTTRRLWAR